MEAEKELQHLVEERHDGGVIPRAGVEELRETPVDDAEVVELGVDDVFLGFDVAVHHAVRVPEPERMQAVVQERRGGRARARVRPAGRHRVGVLRQNSASPSADRRRRAELRVIQRLSTLTMYGPSTMP